MEPSEDEGHRLLLALGRSEGEELRPLWFRPRSEDSRWRRFWRKPAHRHGVEVGAAVLLGGLLVLAAAWLERATGTGGAADWLNQRAQLLVIAGSLGSLYLLRLATIPLRLRRARAACFTSGVVTAVPDLLGLVFGGRLERGVGWERLESYRDHAERVDLYRRGARFAALQVPVSDEEQRTQLLALLDAKGLIRREG